MKDLILFIVLVICKNFAKSCDVTVRNSVFSVLQTHGTSLLKAMQAITGLTTFTYITKPASLEFNQAGFHFKYYFMVYYPKVCQRQRVHRIAS